MGIAQHKIVYGLAAGVASVGFFGAAALASFGPDRSFGPDTGNVAANFVSGPTAARSEDKDDKREGLKKILDGLVQKGVITQAQEDAILAAIREAAPPRERLEAVVKDLFAAAAQYLGMSERDLREKLPGTSLAKIANDTPGKNRDGLVAALGAAATADIAKAVAAGRLTEEQAKQLRDALPGRINSFVDRTWPAHRGKGEGKGHANPRAFLGDVLQTVARYFDMTPAQLKTALAGGKSLGELADSTPGKSRADLAAVLTATANTRIDQAVTEKKLTPEQATALKAKVAAEINELLDRKAPARHAAKP